MIGSAPLAVEVEAQWCLPKTFHCPLVATRSSLVLAGQAVLPRPQAGDCPEAPPALEMALSHWVAVEGARHWHLLSMDLLRAVEATLTRGLVQKFRPEQQASRVTRAATRDWLHQVEAPAGEVERSMQGRMDKALQAAPEEPVDL